MTEFGGQVIQFSVVCPLYVATPMLGYAGENTERPDGVLSPEDVATSTLAGIEEGRFMIFPHPDARRYFAMRASDTDRWIEGMQRLRRRVEQQTDATDLASLHQLI